MKWRQPADRRVVQAILSLFREPLAPGAEAALRGLTLRQWQKSYHWLDCSGLALLFLTRAEALRLTHTLPTPVLARLRENIADNKLRVQSMFTEFTALNTLFTEAGLLYSNLKGFTLCPDSCPDPALRCQLDFDFLVDGADLARCREILEALGYTLRGQGPNVLEFKSHSDQLAVIADLYRPRAQHCVEIHFSTSSAGEPTRDPRLNRLRTLNVMGLDVPALSPVDQFLGQGAHLFAHLCGANTRIAWLLEFATHMRARTGDEAFWRTVREATLQDARSAIALGLSLQLAEQFFPSQITPAQAHFLLDALPPRFAAWGAEYGRRALTADTPGTKLGLLLKDELNRTNPRWNEQKRAALVPLRRAPRLLPRNAQDSLPTQLRNEVLQLRYDLFRLRFHVVEGARYLYESFRWQRRFASRTASHSQADPVLAVRESRP